MKSKIGIKIIAILIGFTALPAGLIAADLLHTPTGGSRNAVQILPVGGVNSDESTKNIEALKSEAANRPKPSFWQIFRFVGKWVLVFVGILVGFILLLRILIKIFELAGKGSPGRFSVGLGVVVICGSLCAMYFLPRSQALVFDSWKTIADVRESNFFFDKIFGVAPNRYDSDIQGRVVALFLKDDNLRNPEQLAGIENLSSLEYLEISDSPLEGTIDVSTFVELKELRLQNTRLRQVTGLERLTKLERLDLDGSPIETIESFGTAQRINLSRTKITDLSALSRSPSLQGISLEEMDLNQIKGFESLPQMEVLSLRKCRQIPLEQVGKMSKLKAIFLDGSDVTDLSSLKNLRELTMISIFETKIERLNGLENSQLVLINTDKTDFTPENLEKFFNRKVIVSRVDLYTFSFSSLFPAHTWRNEKIVIASLFVTGFLLMLPLPFAWQTPQLINLKRVALFMVPGAFLVSILWTISNFNLPFSAGQEMRSGFADVIAICAAIIGVIWLVLMPLLKISLNTRPLRQSALSAPATMFSMLFSWFSPLMFLSPLFIFLGYSFWHDENASGLGALISLLMLFFYFLLPISFIFGGIAFYRKGGNAARYLLSRKVIFPVAGAALSLAGAVSIIAYLAFRPGDLSNVPLRSGVVMGLGLSVLVVINLVFQLVQVGLNWRDRRREIAEVLQGESAEEAVLEVPFRQNYFEFPVLSIFKLLFWKAIFSSPAGEINVINAQDVGQATSARATMLARNTLSGVVVIIQRRQFLRSPEWEFQDLRDWIIEIYKKTLSPIWIVGDWIGESMPENKSIGRKLETLDSLSPFVSGLENISAPSGSIFGMSPPSNIADCLSANQIIERETLEAAGLSEILQNAPTPLAKMVRSIFGQSHLVNRMDVTVRCVETAVAMISLVLVAEYESGKQPDEKLTREIGRLLRKPTFGSWATLFDTITKNSDIAFARQLIKKLETPSPESWKLQIMVETIGGKSVASERETVSETLWLLVAARNTITAHGPATERGTPELYRAVLIVALNFLASLEWRSVAFHGALPDNKEIYFKECLPEVRKNGSPDAEKTGVFVTLSAGKEYRRIDVSRYFRVEETTLSLAVYTEKDRFVEPVSGVYMNFKQGGEN